ncbi:MAG: MarR family winged helix-turn-helix transcriptional regulator [Betaproteobacteria bacterium]
MPDPLRSNPGCTCFSLRRLTRTVTRLYDLHLSAAGIKTTQYSLLRTVAHAPVPIAVLATRLATERTTITRNLRPLIDAGLIVLEQGEDSRQRIVTITAAGREVIKAGSLAWRHAQTELERTLGVDAVRALHLQLDSALRQLTPLLESRSHAVEK